MLRRLVLQFGIALVILLGLAVIAVAISSVVSNLPSGSVSDGFVVGSAWIDSNGDGARDAGEAPLEGACLWAAITPYDFDFNPRICESSPHLTDSHGNWEGQFFAGAGAGSPIYVYAEPPEGFAPTTRLVQSSGAPSFGFAPSAGRSGNYDQIRADAVAGDIATIHHRDLVSRIGWISGLIVLCVAVWIGSGRLLRRLEDAGLA